MQPPRWQPTRLPIPGILQARTLEWVAISFSNVWKWKVKSESEVTQSCPTLNDLMDCSLPGSSIHGIFQARVLGWGAIAFSVHVALVVPKMVCVCAKIQMLKVKHMTHQFSSVAQSCPTLCDPMNHSMPGLCPSPTPGVHPNPCPFSRWCHPTILSSVVPLSSCPQSFPASGSFPMSQLFTSGGHSIGVSASASVLPMNTRTDLL